MAEKNENSGANAAAIGGIAGAVSGIFNTAVTNLVPKARENNLAIAEANARAAEANKTTDTPGFLGGIDQKYLMIGGAVLFIVVILMVSKSK